MVSSEEGGEMVAQELDSEDPFVHYALGALYRDELGLDAEARRAFERYRSLGGSDPAVLSWLDAQ